MRKETRYTESVDLGNFERYTVYAHDVRSLRNLLYTIKRGTEEAIARLERSDEWQEIQDA